MYESVLPHFETLTVNTQQTNFEKSETELSDHASSIQSTTDSNHSTPIRYVDHPIQLSQLHTESDRNFTDDPPLILPIQAAENEQSAHPASVAIASDNRKEIFTSSSETKITIDSTAEEAYTLMNPVGTLTLSLSAGWDEQQQK